MFTTIEDHAICRWEEPEGTYAVAADDDPPCPAGNWVTGHNCARRGDGDWYGDTSVLDETHVEARYTYNRYCFTAVAATGDEADMIAKAFAHWAEGDVFIVGFESTDGDERYVGDIYTADGIAPDLDEAKSYFK